MAAASRRRAQEALARAPAEAWRERARALGPPRELVVDGFEVIAECKLRAPSAGRLAGEAAGVGALVARARAYAGAGAAAISVLTEPTRFDGDLDHLAAVADAVEVPAMCKDFLVDPVQVYQARCAGASGVLLIVRMLDDRALGAMLDAAAGCGMFALVECFDADDARRARAALAGRERVLVGVNTRDLRTLEVRADRLARLAPELPDGAPWVAESGMATPEDVAAAARLGYRAALVGTALMRAVDPGALVAAMRRAGRCG